MHISDYFLARKVANYIGWVGYQNLGDELLFDLIAEAFGQTTPLYKKDYTDFLLRIRRRIPWLREVNLLGGGTLIFKKLFYDRLYELRENPLFVFGTGVCDFEFWCDYIGTDRVPRDLASQWIETLERAEYLSVRGPRSERLLREAGLKREIDVIGDPVFLAYRYRSKTANRADIVGVNFGQTMDMLWSKSDDAVAREMREFVMKLIATGRRVRIFSVTPSDHLFVQQIFANESSSCAIDMTYYGDYRKFLKDVSECSSFVGEKLHAVALALCAGVPAVMIAYRPKCVDLMMSVEQDNYVIRADELGADSVNELVERIDADRETCVRKINDRVKNNYQVLTAKASQVVAKIHS